MMRTRPSAVGICLTSCARNDVPVTITLHLPRGSAPGGAIAAILSIRSRLLRTT